MLVDALKLIEELKRSGFHSSIATTYSVDGGFYGGAVQHCLRNHECYNNILVADVSMLSRALDASPETFQDAGQTYAVVPARISGCFHPKILLRLGSQRACLIVSSANVTAAGWGANLEIVGKLEYRPSDDATAPAGPLVRKAYDYLLRWLAPVRGDAVSFKLDLHLRDSPWLVNLAANAAPVDLGDGTLADLLHDAPGGGPGIMHRFVELVDGEHVKHMTAVSPYWDSDLSALRNMRRAFGMPTTTIALNPKKNAFPLPAAATDVGLCFTAIKSNGEDGRFVHAKIIVVSTDKADHVLFGSANFSDAALGAVGRGGVNAEMSIYRRLKAGTALPMLGLGDLEEVDREHLAIPKEDENPFVGGVSRLPAGQAELVGGSVNWWPSHGIVGEGATMLVNGEAIPVLRARDGFAAALRKAQTVPMVATFTLADGRTTDPVLVHHVRALTENSPGTTDRRTADLFRAVLERRASFLELAPRAAVLFAPEPGRPRGGGGERGEEADRPPVEYETPEDFRAALEPGGGGTGGFGKALANRDPTLVDLFRVVMSGIVAVADPMEALKRERQRARDLDDDLKGGEREDSNEQKAEETDEESDGENEKTSQAKPATPGKPTKERTGYTPKEIEKLRRSILKCLNKFDGMLADLAKETGPVSERLAPQTEFVLRLMTEAARLEHPLDGGGTTKLMSFDDVEKDGLCFVRRAGRILKKIWEGEGKTPPLAPRMPRWPRHMRLPPDLGAFLVMSRWAITRAHLASSRRRKTALAGHVATTAIHVFTATAEFAPVDQAEEERIVRGLDEAIGFVPVETKDLLRRMREFRDQIGDTRPATK